MTQTKWIGKPTKRKEDPRLITGQGTYVDDVRLPDMEYLGFVRSPYAHARLKAIRTDAALALEGVTAIYTGSDLKDAVGAVPTAGIVEGMRIPTRLVVAVDKVWHVGEAVAVVIAKDPYVLSDALLLVEVDYDPLPVVVDPERALEKEAPVIHEEFESNLAYTWAIAGGDVEQAFTDADKVVTQRMINQRLAPIAIEPRGVVAQYHPGQDRLTVWSSSQIPHLLRSQLSLALSHPENQMHVIVPEVGGAFGSKLNVYAEEIVTSHLAKVRNRPLKWIEGRRENFQATIHGRDHITDVEMAVNNDGTICGMRVYLLADIGCYYQILTAIVPTLTALMATGCYKIPAAEINIKAAFTNKMTTDAYRGAGRPEATYMIERMMDCVAHDLGMDPVELRRKNIIQQSDYPFTTPTTLIHDSGDMPACLEKALETADYQALRAEQAEGREQGRYMGIGISSYVEVCAMGPSNAMPAGGWESATVRIEPTGKVTVLTGVSPHGQGQETTFSQIVADELGVDFDDVVVIHGDTDRVQYGIGTFGSRGTAVGGTAMLYALEKLKKKLLTMAAHLLETEEANVTVEGRTYSGTGDGEKTVSLQEVIGAIYHMQNAPPGFEPGLEATGFYEPGNFTFPLGVHIAVVDVDPDTGEVKIRRYLAVDDCGKVINPLTADGQIHGGVAQGVAQALQEEMLYDDQGQVMTGTLMDYALPKTDMLPMIDTEKIVTPSPVNPLGVKGIGEAGTIASTPAVVNAVLDALSPFGVRHVDMPLKPSKIWRVMQEGRAS